MNQYDKVLKMYGQSGLRTIEDWIARGRKIMSGAKARVDAPHRGATLPLYSRDQTIQRVGERRRASN